MPEEIRRRERKAAGLLVLNGLFLIILNTSSKNNIAERIRKEHFYHPGLFILCHLV